METARKHPESVQLGIYKIAKPKFREREGIGICFEYFVLTWKAWKWKQEAMWKERYETTTSKAEPRKITEVRARQAILDIFAA